MKSCIFFFSKNRCFYCSIFSRLIKSNGGRAHAYTVDLCSKTKIYEAAEKLKSDVGPVTILINNAGEKKIQKMLLVLHK